MRVQGSAPEAVVELGQQQVGQNHQIFEPQYVQLVRFSARQMLNGDDAFVTHLHC